MTYVRMIVRAMSPSFVFFLLLSSQSGRYEIQISIACRSQWANRLVYCFFFSANTYIFIKRKEKTKRHELY